MFRSPPTANLRLMKSKMNILYSFKLLCVRKYKHTCQLTSAVIERRSREKTEHFHNKVWHTTSHIIIVVLDANAYAYVLMWIFHSSCECEFNTFNYFSKLYLNSRETIFFRDDFSELFSSKLIFNLSKELFIHWVRLECFLNSWNE